MRSWKLIGLALGLVPLHLAPMPLEAAGFDGSEPLLCAVTEIMECTATNGCEKVTAASIGVATFVEIDVAAGSVSDAGTGARRSTIENMEQVDGKLIIQGAEDGVEGVEDGVGWSASIDHESGEMVVSSAGDGVAFVMFGACTVR